MIRISKDSRVCFIFLSDEKTRGGGGSDTFIWLSGFILRMIVKIILDKS